MIKWLRFKFAIWWFNRHRKAFHDMVRNGSSYVAVKRGDTVVYIPHHLATEEELANRMNPLVLAKWHRERE